MTFFHVGAAWKLTCFVTWFSPSENMHIHSITHTCDLDSTKTFGEILHDLTTGYRLDNVVPPSVAVCFDLSNEPEAV